MKIFEKGQKNQLSLNFNSTEFDCHGKDCCSETQIDENLINFLQKIREYFNKPIRINSGYRCPQHNKKVGGATRSNHMYGQAADISISGIKPIKVARYAESIGVPGIGVYNTFVHIDTRKNKYFWYDGGASNVKTFQEEASKKQEQEQEQENSTQLSPKEGIISTDEDAQKIWNFLMDKIGNEFGVAGLMGNLYAESAMKSNNLQSSYERSLGYNDETYTKAVDDGKYNNFSKDKAGYGLAQWTHWSRKQGLLNYANKKNKSIGDYQLQLEFLYNELIMNYKEVLTDLKECKNILEASNSVLFNFEKPANQGIAVQTTRASYGQKYYDKFANKKITSDSTINSNHEEVEFKDNNVTSVIGVAKAKCSIHIREEASTNSKSLDILRAGDSIEVLEILDNQWYKIVWKNSKTGYAFTSNVQEKYYSYSGKVEEYAVKVTANALNIRDGAGIKFRVIGLLNKNVVRTIVEEKDGWGKLKNKSGWIKLEYTQKIQY